MLVVGEKGELSMFWLAHKNEEDKCKLEDNNDPSGKSIDEEKVDLKQNDTHNYRLYQNASGVVVRDMILVCGGFFNGNRRHAKSTDTKNKGRPSNKCWYWHKDEPNSDLKLMSDESNIPISEDQMDPRALGQVLMASTFVTGIVGMEDDYMDKKYHVYVLVLSTFDDLESRNYTRHFFGGNVESICVSSTEVRKLQDPSEIYEPHYEHGYKHSKSSPKTCNARISWTRLTAPTWDQRNGVEFPCVLFYGKHFMILGVSQTYNIPKWGAIYYDAVADKWIDFATLDTNEKRTIWSFPGKPREHFACAIYRNNLIFSGGIDVSSKNETVILNDTHIFNIRYTLYDKDPWSPQYNIAAMDDEKKDNCGVCPVWGHTLAVIQDSTREVLFSAFGCTKTNCSGDEEGGKIYQYDHNYNMDKGKWTVVHESQKSLSSSNHNIGLTIPMKWIPGCMGNISGAPAGLNAMYNQWKTIIFLIYSFTVVF